jgi:molecular chaperone GrpE (heat shock protein)
MQSPNRKSTAAPKDGARVAELEEEVQELKRKLERADARLVRQHRITLLWIYTAQLIKSSWYVIY